MGIFDDIGDFFKDDVGGTIKKVTEPVENAFKSLIDQLLKFLQPIINFVGSIDNFIIDIFNSIIDFFKPVIDIVLATGKLIGLADDLVLLGLKVFKFLFSDIIVFITRLGKQFFKLIEPTIKLIDFIIDMIDENIHLPFLLVFMSPIFLGLYITMRIINTI